MPFVTTADGTEIFYKDWGSGQPIVFHHGWPLSCRRLGRPDDVLPAARLPRGRPRPAWPRPVDADRRTATTWTPTQPTPPRSPSTSTCATPSTSATRPAAARSPDTSPSTAAGRVAKAVLISAMPPLMLKTDANPGGLPLEVFDGFRAGSGVNRAQFYRDVAAGPFYGFNRRGADGSEGIIRNWWRQGMMGGVQRPLRRHQGVLRDRPDRGPQGDRRAHPGDARRRRPGRPDRRLGGARRSSSCKHGTLKVYPGYPHGIFTIHADVINADLLAFIQE